jgi:hypothetical protein
MTDEIMKTILPNYVIKQMILDETSRRIRRAILFHSIRKITAMLGVVLIISAFLNSAGVPRPWQIILSPVWAGAWTVFGRWMTRGMKDERPSIIPVRGHDIEGAQ